MKKLILILLLVSVKTILHAQSIEQTLVQISEMKLEIEHNSILVNDKIEALKNNNPIFADQDPFESDAEYLGRMSTAMPALDRIRKEYLGDKWRKMSILRGRVFETNNIQVDLDVNKYDANKEEWPINIFHNDYQKDVFHNVVIKIAKDKARSLHTNWDKVKKTGILTIDVGDKIGLAKIILNDPISGFKFTHEFRPMLKFDGQHPLLSSDGKSLFYIKKGSSYYDDFELYNRDLATGVHIKEDRVKSWRSSDKFSHALSLDGSIYARTASGATSAYTQGGIKIMPGSGYCKGVAISPDGKFVARSNNSRIELFNLETEKVIMELSTSIRSNSNKFSIEFNTGGNLLLVKNDKDSEIFDLESQNMIKRYDGSSVAFHPNLNAVCYVYTRQGDYDYKTSSYPYTSTIKLRSISINGGLIASLDISNKVSGKIKPIVCFSTDGKNLGVTTDSRTFLYRLSSKNGAMNFSYVTGKSFLIDEHVAFTPDNKYLIGQKDKDIKMYRTMFDAEGDVLEQKTIIAPPNLTANVSFYEPSGNNYLDALEKGYFEVEIKNSGQGPAKGISITVQPNKTDKLNYNNTYIEEIAAGASASLKIPIEAYLEVANGTHDFTFNFEEVNGFSPQDVQIQFSTKEYQLPDFYVVDFQMNEPEISKNGKIDDSEIIDLNIRVGNKGIGTGKGVFVKFTLGDNVFVANTPVQVNIGNLEFNETIDIPLSFFVNKECSEQIPIYIDIADETNLAIVKKQRIELFKSSNVASVKKTVIKGIDENKELTIKGLNSLVDKNIPRNEKVENRFALVIGNEDYSTFQTSLQSEQNVDYAVNDATIFKKYCLNTLGVNEENMFDLINATAGEMSQEIDLISKIIKKLGNKAELIVYYAGHGYPDELTKVPYLIPVDVSSSNLSSAIKLDDFYQKLASTNASKITIFLDACFTGGGRNSGLVASRGITVKPKEGSLSGNIVVFSASSAEQSSLPYHDEGHGMFTYFLLKKFQESKGNVTLGELSEYLNQNVPIKSLRINQKEQDPKVNTSQKVINDWRNWKF